MRSPQNSAHPTTTSSGSPATRRSTSRVELVAAGSVEEQRASSSANTQPAARSVAVISAWVRLTAARYAAPASAA